MPFAACSGVPGDCDGCAFGCVEPVEPVGPVEPVPAVPERGAFLLAGLLMLGMGWAARRRKLVA
jgi:MYXO-CTERM domain-containing protein